MRRATLAGLDHKSLRIGLLLMFFALAIPAAVLIRQAVSQLKWEAFHQYQVLARELAARIDGALAGLIAEEQARPFSDYSFFVNAGDPASNVVQRSPLSVFPPPAAFPGLIGFFQVDPGGVLSTPLLPRAGSSAETYGISEGDRRRRLALVDQIRRILGENRLVQETRPGAVGGESAAAKPDRRRDRETPAEVLKDSDESDVAGRRSLVSAQASAKRSVPAQEGFDRLNEAASTETGKKKQAAVSSLGRVEELKLEQRFQSVPPLAKERRTVLNRASAPEPEAALRQEASAPAPALSFADEAAAVVAPNEMRVSTFESEIDPFELSLLESGQFVLFRKVWRDGQRYIQGLLLERGPFLRGAAEAVFRDAAVAATSDLIVAYRGDVLALYSSGSEGAYPLSSAELGGELLYQTPLSAPFGDLELIFSVQRLPPGPGGAVIAWTAGILALVLLGGFFLMYRLGARQIELARQQQDFVSAVSHELKTPLTSIRMYGEMLREGWVPEEKKPAYYTYIHDESERLSRLINNVLQLARMTRNDLKVECRRIGVAELADGIRSKIATPVERAGFELRMDCSGDAASAQLLVDADYFAQIIINLVDNALKFSRNAETKRIDLACRLVSDGTLVLSVRDYGPGVPRDQMKKIFRLFYRSESELTRETVGTGIGLALVRQLVLAMQGRVDVLDASPGAEFRISFPVV